ncbi:MAG: ABC-2 transporter permease [Coriobacteriaceae bacterium]|nr:ABC-2 transporter permease [Coriobacteriaceae bacterium]
MDKIKSFIKLDYITIKPYLSVKNLLIFGCIMVFLTAMSGNLASGLGVGMMLGTIYLGYPFALGEKSNMDALYTTLSVDRKTVVAGRFAFIFLFNLCSIIAALVIAAITLFIAGKLDFNANGVETLVAIVMIAALFAVIQLFQLPVFFRYGYTKAKLLTFMPFIALMVGYFLISGFAGQLFGDLQFILSVGNFLAANQMLIIVLIILAMLLATFISYRISVKAYAKREF